MRNRKLLFLFSLFSSVFWKESGGLPDSGLMVLLLLMETNDGEPVGGEAGGGGGGEGGGLVLSCSVNQ